MKVTAVRKYNPGYPDRSLVLKNPALLKVMPKRWKNSAVVGCVISGLLLSSMTACQKEESEGKNVAPLFLHGDGNVKYHYRKLEAKPQPSNPLFPIPTIPTVSHGAKAIRHLTYSDEAPRPMYVGNYPGFDANGQLIAEDFLNEEDALFILQEELSKQGIQLNIAKGNQSQELNTADTGFKKGSDLFVLDGVDQDKKVGFEFVSVVDTAQAEEGKEVVEPNDKSYSTLEMAKSYRKAILDATGEMKIGIFYDPGKEQVENKVSYNKTELLKAQVKDFANWLKSQGIG